LEIYEAVAEYWDSKFCLGGAGSEFENNIGSGSKINVQIIIDPRPSPDTNPMLFSDPDPSQLKKQINSDANPDLSESCEIAKV
jgi:hypothetical protein